MFSTREELIDILQHDNNLEKFNNMTVKFRNEKSISGYEWNVVKSALQKYIRRNNVDMAIKMAMEMYCFDFIDNGKRIITNGLHRLQIIFLEDIGCGNLYLWPELCDWFDIIYREREKDDANRNRKIEIEYLTRIIINLCKSRKIRCGSYMNAICQLTTEDRGKIKYCQYTETVYCGDPILLQELLIKYLDEKSWKSIVVLKEYLNIIDLNKRQSKSKLQNELNKILNNYFTFMECCNKWKKNVGHLRDAYLLYFVQLCHYLYGGDELQLYETDVCNQWDENKIGKIQLDDFVYDKHVRLSKDDSNKYFINVSSYVEPRSQDVALPNEFITIYKWFKGDRKNVLEIERNKNTLKSKKLKIWKFPEKESQLDFICRAQLVTSYSKTDTYYAKGIEKDVNQLWLIKGPYIERTQLDEFLKFQKIKKERKLPFIICFSRKMIVDLWPEHPGIGVRHKLKENEEAYFIFCKSVIPESELSFEYRSSKKWEKTKVVKLKEFSVNVFKLNNMQMVYYLKNIAFRLEYNIGDMADRNFIVSGNIVYSVDESATKSNICLKTQLGESKYSYIKEYFEKVKNKLDIVSRNTLEKVFN